MGEVFLHSHEELNSDPSHACKKLGAVGSGTCLHPECWENGAGKTQGSAGQLV